MILASTAALPTTRPPMIDTVCPMDWGQAEPRLLENLKGQQQGR